MVLFAYSIEDDNSDGQSDIYRFRLDGTGVQRTGGLPASSTTQDYEGLGTRGTGASAVVDAITEGTFSSPGNFLARGVDAGPPSPPVRVPLGPDGNRFGSESGFDYTQNGVGYDIQSSVSGPTGSQLYRITNATSSNPTVTAVGSRKSEFADGLAIANSNSVGWASDFYTEDGDPNEIYRLNLNTGAITLTSRIVRPNGSNLGVNFDSGLAFTPNGQQLYALTENGRIYRITDFTDNDGTAVASIVGNFNIASLPNGDRGEFEGLAIIDEPTSSAPSFTGAGATIAGASDAGNVSGTDEEIKPLETASVNTLLGSANPSQPEPVDAAVMAAVIPTDDVAGV